MQNGSNGVFQGVEEFRLGSFSDDKSWPIILSDLLSFVGKKIRRG